MTPDIKPFLLEADRQRPDLRVLNTFVSCEELLRLTLSLAGSDWAFVGKTSAMDGAAAHPSWFAPRTMSLIRPDGQAQDVLVDGVSQDAAWYLPTKRQVKVIVFSTANEPGPWDHGPAKLTPYEINPINPETGEPQYRWHNPPIPQPGTPAPPSPLPPAPISIPSYEALGGDTGFRQQIGVPLQADAAIVGQSLNDGSSVWFSRPIYRILAAYAKGKQPDVPAIIKSVRNEWRAVMGLPPLP